MDMIIVSDDFAGMSLPERLRYLQREWKSRIPLEAFGYTETEFRNFTKRSIYVKDAIRNGIEINETKNLRRSEEGSLPKLKSFTRDKNDRS